MSNVPLGEQFPLEIGNSAAPRFSHAGLHRQPLFWVQHQKGSWKNDLHGSSLELLHFNPKTARQRNKQTGFCTFTQVIIKTGHIQRECKALKLRNCCDYFCHLLLRSSPIKSFTELLHTISHIIKAHNYLRLPLFASGSD